MVKKAIVFDNSGTLIERYRAIKDIKKDKIFTNISSQDIVMGSKTYAMVVLQFNSADLLKIAAYKRDRIDNKPFPELFKAALDNPANNFTLFFLKHEFL